MVVSELEGVSVLPVADEYLGRGRYARRGT